MQLFGGKQASIAEDFGYLDKDALYFDSACQTLRPRQVIDAQREYFEQFNACGGRVRYAWGERVDRIVEETRERVLAFLQFSKKEYTVAFTLNTTYGINLVLQQLPLGAYERICTSEIEHNSVFLPTMTAAHRLDIPRTVLMRAADGALLYEEKDLKRAVVVVNAFSNIDSRMLPNIRRLVDDTHRQGGIVLIDAAQAMAHAPALLAQCGADALCASAHKMYGPSLGVIVIKKDLADKLHPFFVGGGMVNGVDKDSFSLIESEDELFSRLEPGLQNYSGIIGLHAAMPRLAAYAHHEESAAVAKYLFEEISKLPVTCINASAGPVISFYSDKIDSHRLALYLSQQNIMVRSGYFCCHYYLLRVKKYPPLVRFSVGAYNTLEQAERVVDTLTKILTTL